MPPSDPTTIQIPRWIQLVGLPLLLVGAWIVAGAVRHVVFLFLVGALIALLLNPLVRGLGRAFIPRGIAVAIVYLAFAAAVGLAILALATVVVKQTRSASHKVDRYFTVESGRPPRTGAERDLARFQHWLNTHHLQRIKVQKQGQDFLNNIGTRDVEKYTTKALNWAESAGVATAQLLFNSVLVLVVSIYMLLDMQRLTAAVDRRFPPRPGSQALIPRMEYAVVRYVRGQMLLSLIIGASAGLGLWLLGITGVVPGIDNYALIMAVWVAIAELIPYVGPWLGAIPAVFYALVQHPISALWVTLLFLGIHQLEGHVVAPNVLGSALRLHPLLVIFGLLAGGEIYGLAGILVALPLLAAGRAAWEFFSERIVFEPWAAGIPVVPVESGPAAEPPVRVSGPVEGVSGEQGGSPDIAAEPRDEKAAQPPVRASGPVEGVSGEPAAEPRDHDGAAEPRDHHAEPRDDETAETEERPATPTAP
jgi:predicted PurR-regulated permease PerM